MRKATWILLVLLFGCGAKSSENTFIVDVEDDSAVQVDESFDIFFDRFKTDSTFQIEHTKFPWRLLIQDIDGSTVEETSEEDWEHDSFYYEDGFASRQADAYTQNIISYGDTVKLELRGIDNGIHVDYEFVKENNLWFLVSGKDYSD